MIELTKKNGNEVVDFAYEARFLIDHPKFQAQTDDLVDALMFLTQFFPDPSPISLVGGFGPNAKEYDWRAMLVHFSWSPSLH